MSRYTLEHCIHPGETLEEILENKGITQKELANTTGFTPAFINKVTKGETDILPEFAIKLEDALGIKSSFWINLQANYNTEVSKEKKN